MFYTSICGGYHGNDGKGLSGNYPDLTREKLLEIERREAFLKAQIAKEEKIEGYSIDRGQRKTESYHCVYQKMKSMIG